MASLTPTSTITAAQPANPNGYNWGSSRFGTPSFGNNQSTSYPAIYKNGSDQYVALGKISGYDGVSPDTATFHTRVLKDSADPWPEQDSANAPPHLDSSFIAESYSTWDTSIAVVQSGTNLYIFYFVLGADRATSVLAVKTFDMDTDTWGAEIQSAIPPQDTTSLTEGGRSTGTGLCASLDQVTGNIFVVTSDNRITVGGNVVLRPGYAAFDPTGAAWLHSSFQRLGNDNTVNADETVSTIACDCNGTCSVIFQSQNFDTDINTFFYQAIKPNGTLSAVQATGITEAAVTVSGIRCSSSRMLLTPTEIVLVYADKWTGGAFREINAARAPLPASGVLPVWTLSAVLDLTGVTGNPGFDAWVPLYIPTDGLVISYTWTWGNNFRSKVGMLHWNGATWDDDFSPTAAVPLALTNGPDVTEDANIEYDFTAPITLIGSPASLGTNQQYLYSLLSNTTRACPTAVPATVMAVPAIATAAALPPFVAQIATGGGGGGGGGDNNHVCTPNPFIIHKFRFRQRVVGEYIDGTINEYYESPEFSVAPGRVGELKDFLVDYDISAAGGRLELYSDLPNHALALVRTLAVPYYTAGRQVYAFPLENPADVTTEELPAGQLFKVRLYPPPGGILRLHGRAVFRARVIGVYFEGQNGEVFETQDLDLAGGMGIFRNLEITAQTSGAITVETYTELPNQDMRLIDSQTINPRSTTTRRLPVILRLPGNCKGELQRFRVTGSGSTRILGMKVLGRRLEVNGGAWQWYPIPFEATLDAWMPIQMPVRSTPEAFDWVDVPVDVIE